MAITIKSMGYARVFSLGNYENEKISVECDIQPNDDPTTVYLELKKVVENAHNLRHELREYHQAKTICEKPDYYTGNQVKQATETINNFEQKYSNLLQVEQHALLEVKDNSDLAY